MKYARKVFSASRIDRTKCSRQSIKNAYIVLHCPRLRTSVALLNFSQENRPKSCNLYANSYWKMNTLRRWNWFGKGPRRSLDIETDPSSVSRLRVYTEAYPADLPILNKLYIRKTQISNCLNDQKIFDLYAFVFLYWLRLIPLLFILQNPNFYEGLMLNIKEVYLHYCCELSCW